MVQVLAHLAHRDLIVLAHAQVVLVLVQAVATVVVLVQVVAVVVVLAAPVRTQDPFG